MNSYTWTITPTGIINEAGEQVINRLVYNLTVTDGAGAKGDLGAPGIAYLSEPISDDDVAPGKLARLLDETLGPNTVALFKCIADKNLTAFTGPMITVGTDGA